MAEAIRALIRFLKQLPNKTKLPRMILREGEKYGKEWVKRKGLTTIRFTPKSSVIGRIHYLKDRNEFTTNFRTQMHVELRSIETGERIVREMYVNHHDLMTPGELHNTFLEGWETQYPVYDIISSYPIYGKESKTVYETVEARIEMQKRKAKT